MPSQSRIERIGHRGAPRERLENTLPSFRRAVELGATGVELDVHVTADGVPVVHHDPDLHSDVTPRRFAGVPIANLNSRDTDEIRLKSGDPLPRLLDVLSELTPKTRVYVEIKRGSVSLTAKVLAPFRHSIAVHSFDHDAIEEMARVAPDISRGVLIERQTEDVAAIVNRTRATDVWPAWKLVDERFMTVARDCGARVIPWTVNSARACRRLAELGVAGICTNDVTLLRDLP